MNKQVLIIGNSPKEKGGITTVINQFRKCDWEKYNYKAEFISTYINKNIIYKILFFLVGLIRIFIKVKFYKIKIAHIHMSYGGSFTRANIIRKICKSNNVKVVIHLHGSEFKKWYDNVNAKKKEIIKEFIKSSDAFIVLGENWKKIINEIEPNCNVIVLNNCINITNKTAKWSPNINFLYLGVLIKRKGISDLLNEFEKIIKVKKYSNSKLFIAGTGSEEKKLKEIVKLKQLEKNVIFDGWISDTEKENELLKSQVLVLPSYNEGLPMSILEALSYGIPVLTTDVGDISSVVKEEKNGYLFNPGDKKRLFENLVKFCNLNKEEWEKMSRYSKKIIKDHFSDERYFDTIISLYEQILNMEEK